MNQSIAGSNVREPTGCGKEGSPFRHEVPKEPGVTQPRINLTFRRIDLNPAHFSHPRSQQMRY
jgi:hypothetical protein